jgi:anaerobic selenocysteine-containing dehydrogenase
MGLNRRDFLKLVAGSAITLPLFDCSSQGYHSSVRQNEWLPKDESWVKSVCQTCPGGCGILARVVDGKVVKIEGNPMHPINRGTLCPWGQSGLQLLYNPDRLKAPLKRVGERGSGEWEEIGWDKALDAIVLRLEGLKEASQTHRLMLMCKEKRGMIHELFSRFMQVFGSPNYFCDDTNNSLIQAFYNTQRIDDLLAYEFENSNFILSFGSSFLTSWPSPVQSLRAYAYLRQGRPGKKAKIVQIEPRLSITASLADNWIPIKPGTEGLLALGIAYVIIKENLYDKNYVDEFTQGFEDWVDGEGNSHIGFKNMVLDKYRLDFVSGLTGVPVDSIVDIAKDFASNKPSVAIVDTNAMNYTNGLYNALAIHSLNAITGSIDVPGGVLVRRPVPLQDLPPVVLDDQTEKSLIHPRLDEMGSERFPLAQTVMSVIPNNMIEENPYPIEALFLYKSNPLYTAYNAEVYRKAFEKIPLIVSFSSFIDESTLYADLILPDKTFLEKYQYVESSPVSKISVIGLTEPVLDNLYNTRPTEDVLLEITQRMGKSFSMNFPWKNSREFVQYKIDALFRARKGTVFTDQFEENQLKLLEERGWWAPQYQSADRFKEELNKKGGWWDPSYSYGVRSYVLRTPSKRFEFYSQFFKEKMKDFKNIEEDSGDVEIQGNSSGLKISATGDEVFMPHYEPPDFEGEEGKFPFLLHIYKPLNFSDENLANQPWFQEILGFYLNMDWDSWAEINPETARKLGVKDHDLIWIESLYGKIQLKAKIHPGCMPDVIAIPYGLGHKAIGRWARNRGANPVGLIGPGQDALTGQSILHSVRIKVSKA